MKHDVARAESVSAVRRNHLSRRQSSIRKAKRSQGTGSFGTAFFGGNAAVHDQSSSTRRKHHDLVRVDSVVEAQLLFNLVPHRAVSLDTMHGDPACWKVMAVQRVSAGRIHAH